MIENKKKMCKKLKYIYCRRLTGVSVEADGGVEAFAVLQDVQGEQHLGALPLLLDPVQGPLQVQPEADLLQRRARRRVAVQLGHLRTTWRR